MTVSGQNKLIAPVLPGNDATTLKGDGANFMINLGQQQLSISVQGYIVPIKAAQYPTLSDAANDKFMLDSGLAATVGAEQSGKSIRNQLLVFWADQPGTSSVAYDNFQLLWPEWGAASGDSTINSISYRPYEGNMTNIRITEVAGEPDQFAFMFDWVVGDV
jgi:hypothetical protein